MRTPEEMPNKPKFRRPVEMLRDAIWESVAAIDEGKAGNVFTEIQIYSCCFCGVKRAAAQNASEGPAARLVRIVPPSTFMEKE
jgi:hypothetical protein